MHLMVKIHLQLLVPLLPSFDISERSIQQVPITSSFGTSLKDFKNKRKKYIYGIENSSSDNSLKFEGKSRCWNLILGCSLFISTKLILWLKFSKNFRKIQMLFFLFLNCIVKIIFKLVYYELLSFLSHHQIFRHN